MEFTFSSKPITFYCFIHSIFTDDYMLRKYCNYYRFIVCPILSSCCSVRKKEGNPCFRENNTPSKCENLQQVFNEIIVLRTEHKRCRAYCNIIVVRGDLFKKKSSAINRFQSIDLRLHTCVRIRRWRRSKPLFGRILKWHSRFVHRFFLLKNRFVF